MRYSDRRIAGLPMIVIAMMLVGAGSRPLAADGWQWSLTPYLWGSSLALDVEVDDQQVVGGDVSFGDLLDKLDFAGQIHFEGRKNEFGFFADLTYIDLSDDPKVFEDVEDVPGTITARGDLEETLIEAGGVWNPSGDGTGFELLFGTRILDIDQEIDLQFSEPGIPDDRVDFSKTFYDAMVGVRYLGAFSDSWTYRARIDFSAGDTEGTWNGLLGLGYTFGSRDQFSVLFGYRHMEVEVESERPEGRVESELTMSGPIAGFQFAF